MTPEKGDAAAVASGARILAALEPAGNDVDLMSAIREPRGDLVHAHRAAAADRRMIGVIVDDVKNSHRSSRTEKYLR